MRMQMKVSGVFSSVSHETFLVLAPIFSYLHLQLAMSNNYLYNIILFCKKCILYIAILYFISIVRL